MRYLKFIPLLLLAALCACGGGGTSDNYGPPDRSIEPVRCTVNGISGVCR